METTENTRSVERGDREELRRLLAGYDTAILTTRGADGHFHARPMAMRKQTPSVDELWFVTWDDTEKVHDLEQDGSCCLAFVTSERASSYVSMSGRAELVRDPVRLRELWDAGWNAWFPDGPGGRLMLIRFVPEHAEYVRASTGRLAEVTDFVRSLIGRPAVHAPKKELELH